jgi:hypothetical protein
MMGDRDVTLAEYVSAYALEFCSQYRRLRLLDAIVATTHLIARSLVLPDGISLLEKPFCDGSTHKYIPTTPSQPYRY